jgi:hypothetical protein
MVDGPPAIFSRMAHARFHAAPSLLFMKAEGRRN